MCPNIRITADSNGRCMLPQAIQTAGRFRDFDITWIEKPIYFDDVEGDRRLADSIATPIALGERLYTANHFRDFLHAGAVHYV
jgi:L-alanine-DL-glutamate epimerase-like enolase superfamily enzyme